MRFTFKLITALVMGSVATSALVQPASAQSIDTNGVYVLKTQFRGAGECLEGNRRDGDFNGRAVMLPCGPMTGQQWRFVSLGGGYYKLKTVFRGDGECLEGNQNSSSYKDGAAFMDNCRNVSGQAWKMEAAGNGFYRLKTQFRGEDECFESGSSETRAFMDRCQNVSGQLWKIERIR